MENLYINSFVSIQNNTIQVNGKDLYFDKHTDDDFFKTVYKSLNISYPKFYKMDNMSKLGFLATEFLLESIEKKKDTSLIFANRSASLDTDIAYQASIQDHQNFIPSPSVFVYTLPNIVLGEISIRNNFTGENIFLVLDELKPEILLEIIFLQKKLKKADSFIVTWVEVIENEIEIFSFYIDENRTKKSLLLNNKNIHYLLKKG